MQYFIRAENQLVVLQQIQSVLIDIHMKGGVERMDGELIMVGKGDYVLAESGERIIDRLRRVAAFVEDAVHLCVGMEIGPLPINRHSLGAK